MKNFRQLSFIATGMALFIGLNILLNLSPTFGLSPSEKPLKNSFIAQTAQTKDCVKTLIQADELYRPNNREQAIALYRQCKPRPSNNNSRSEQIPDPVYTIEVLGGGQKLWANVQDGIQKNKNGSLNSKIYFNLVPLTKNYPQFIPAHLELAKFCQQEAEFCQQYAQGDSPKSPLEVIERVSAFYPGDVNLVKLKIQLLAEEEDYLEASIAARQFAIIYNNHEQALYFNKLADEYFNKFNANIKNQLISNTILANILSAGQAVLTGDPYQDISGLEAVKLLLQGESNFGQEAALSLVNNYKTKQQLVENKAILSYIQGVAEKITPYMGRKLDYQYYVIKDDSLNAFALPGGKVFINTGAILNTKSEAELAGLLGHEISHAVLSHGFQRMSQSLALNSLNNLISTQGITAFSDLFAIFQAQYSRENERQADILGTRVLAASGYAADGLYNLMDTLRKQQGNQATDLLATHPAPIERVQYLESLIEKNGYNRYAYEGVKKHLEIQQIVKNLS